MKRGAIMFSILALLSAGPGAEEPVRLPISWTGSKGARGYVIQIKSKKDGKLLPEIRVKKAEHVLTVPPGDYMLRVGKVNKFRKLSRWSPWEFVQVRKKPVVPAPRTFTPAEVTGGTDARVTIEGKNFQENTRVTFESGRRSIHAKVKLLNKNTLQAGLNLRGAAPGQYDAVIRNPFLPPVRRKNVLVVRPAKKTTSRAAKKEPVSPTQGPKMPTGVIWRAAVLPGWGHWYAGRRTAGLGFAGLFAALVFNRQDRLSRLQTLEREYNDRVTFGYSLAFNNTRQDAILSSVFLLGDGDFGSVQAANVRYNLSVYALLFAYGAQLIDAVRIALNLKGASGAFAPAQSGELRPFFALGPGEALPAISARENELFAVTGLTFFY